MPNATKMLDSSVDDTKNITAIALRETMQETTARRHAGFRGPDTKGTCSPSLKEKRAHAGMASSAVQSLSLIWDPQLVQQDEQDHDSNMEENHIADRDDFGNIPNTAPDVYPPISPRHVIPQRSPSLDPLLPQPNDNGVPAPLNADERVLMEDIYMHVKCDDLHHSLAFISWTRIAPPRHGAKSTASHSYIYYYGCMCARFPELQLCEGDWKAEAMAVEYYHGWVDWSTNQESY
ncbi:hypothetical protein BD769DRAFT_1667192 [Suillus cothurnatus]|nr:hypothetical protein BD769DRAFT_1667192 [Suillus cothurnatus]